MPPEFNFPSDCSQATSSLINTHINIYLMQAVNISPPWYWYTCPASSIARGGGGTPTIRNVAFLCFLKLTITKLHLQVSIVFHHTNANNSQWHIKTRSQIPAVPLQFWRMRAVSITFHGRTNWQKLSKSGHNLLRRIQLFLKGGNDSNICYTRTLLGRPWNAFLIRSSNCVHDTCQRLSTTLNSTADLSL
jgi:hypothetical protein